MGIRDFFRGRNRPEPEKRSVSQIAICSSDVFRDICTSGYVTLDKCPEIIAGCRRIAELMASATIHLMENTASGDRRIINELSRAIDIEPMPTMTRPQWMEAIVMNLLLHGAGNSIVVPHTWEGFLQSLEPIAAERVSFEAISYREYKVQIDGKNRDPASLLHFVMNPDKTYLWKGCGLQVPLSELANNLKQARATESAFLSSEYKPSLVVRVDALIDEMSNPAARQKLVEEYVKPAIPGQPWVIPAEQFDIQQIKPLSLTDLAINESMELNKRTVAAILGVPGFVLGEGVYNRDEWNTFIQTKIMYLAKLISAELTRKLIINPKWYLTLNVWSLMDYDLSTMSNVLLDGSDRGFVNGDEWRDRMHLPPAGLTEYKVLENYIPADMSGNQKKLIQDE